MKKNGEFSIGEIVKVKGDKVFKIRFEDIEDYTDNINYIDSEGTYFGEIEKEIITNDAKSSHISYEIRVPFLVSEGLSYAYLSVDDYNVERAQTVPEKYNYISQFVQKDKVVLYNTLTNTFVKECKNGSLQIKQFDSYKEGLDYSNTFVEKGKMKISNPYLFVYHDKRNLGENVK